MNDLDKIDERIDTVGEAVKHLAEAIKSIAHPDVDLLAIEHVDRALSKLQSCHFWWMKKEEVKP